jgi:NADH-quinone oxidoreductase subunit A
MPRLHERISWKSGARDPTRAIVAGWPLPCAACRIELAGPSSMTVTDALSGAEVRCIVLAQYWPILLFIGVAAGLGVVLLVIGMLVGPRRPEAIKLAPYECGFEAFEDARMRFDVRYYLLAILFIIFDLEIAFLFPWAVVFQHIGIVALVEMALFLLLLVIGFAYVWKKGALEWE